MSVPHDGDALKASPRALPLLFGLRSNTLFILATVGIGFFCDLFLYGLIVPILPRVLEDRIGIPPEQVQSQVDALLAVYAASSVINSPISGFIADWTSSRRTPYLIGLSALLFGTLLLFAGRTLAVLYAARIIQGASSAFVWTIGLTLCMDTVGPDNLGKTIGTISSFISVGALTAPLIGGTLYSKAGYGAVGLVCVCILVVDLVMRVLVIEKKVAARYDSSVGGYAPTQHADAEQHTGSEQPTESSPLLDSPSNNNNDDDDDDDPAYRIPPRESLHWIYQKVPLFYPLTHSVSLIMAYFLACSQGAFLGAFDATVPTRASELFGFDAWQIGILFVPLVFFSCVFGPVGGWAVDRFGTKLLAIVAYGLLAPFTILLRVPQAQPQPQQPILYGSLLGFCGMALALTDSPGMVESGLVIDRFYKRNKTFFGEQGPYASSYGFGSMAFSGGLTIGPILAGELKERIGYANMNAVLGGISILIAVASYFLLGDPPRVLRKKAASPA